MNQDARKLEKRKRRAERIRIEKHRQRFRPVVTGADDRAPVISGPANPGLTMERASRQIQRLIERSGLRDPAEINRLLAGHVLDRGSEHGDECNAGERAQDLAFKAMEATDAGEALELCSRALELDPDCVDARVTIGRLRARTPGMLVNALQDAIEAGERSLGDTFFSENRGHFWGMVETRPYMRARYDLALLLLKLGQSKEAIQHMEALLDLNPNDNQGVRDTLLACYLEADDRAGAERLIEQFEDDSSAVFRWGRALARFLAGDLRAAQAARAEAREANAFVEPCLTGRKRLPAQLPDHYSPGHESEAWHCAHVLHEAWAAHAEALAWLREPS
jgi:tetratricopeptide (TPR) repeat protein